MDGTILSGANDGVIKVWEKKFPSQMKSIGEMKGHTLGVTSIARDGYFLFSSGEDCNIVMWDSRTREQLRTFKGHSLEINMLCIIPENGNIISCSRDGSIFIWDYRKEKIIFVIFCFHSNISRNTKCKEQNFYP
jgi:WD40 repeat protein